MENHTLTLKQIESLRYVVSVIQKMDGGFVFDMNQRRGCVLHYVDVGG